MSPPPPEVRPVRPAEAESLAEAPLAGADPRALDAAGPSDGADDGYELSPDQTRAVRKAVEGPAWIRSWPLLLIALLLSLYTIRETRVVLLPVLIAILLQFVLGPAVRSLRRVHVPAPAAATLVLALAAGFTITVTALAWEPAAAWVQTLPRDLRGIEQKLEALREPVERVTEASRRVDELASLDGPANGERAVIAETAGVGRAVWDQARGFAVNSLLAGALLFFLLAAQDSFLTKLVSLLPRLREKKTAVEVMRSIERDVSRYLVTISAINLGLGVSVGLAVWALGLPNPVLWGALAGLFNFVPYLGTSVGIVLCVVAGLLSIDGTWRALLPALAYFLLSSLEGMIVTPLFLGKRFRLSPVILFIWLLTWSWMWGIPGAILAVPLLVILAIVVDHLPALRPISVFLKA